MEPTDNVLRHATYGRKPEGGDGGSIDRMEARLSEVEKAIVGIHAILPTLATKSDIADVRREFAEDRTANVKWIAGTALTMSAVLISVMTYLAKAPTQTVAPPPPTVIYVSPPPAVAASRP